MNPFKRLYNFHGRLSRRDFLIYWLWVFLLPKFWPFLAVFIYYLVCGVSIKAEELAVGGTLSVFLHLLLMSFFLGAIWRRLNDIGFSVWPKLLICSLPIVILPPYGWILQLVMLLLPSRRRC